MKNKVVTLHSYLSDAKAHPFHRNEGRISEWDSLREGWGCKVKDKTELEHQLRDTSMISMIYC